jgi:DNA-binding transcriptional LysR family regulator
MEFRQLRFFVTLAEELHFGRAAAREHIVQSALSQQIRRLERELRVRLLDRDTHHVALTPAGAAFLVDARQMLAHAEQAAAAARRAARPAPMLRAGILDASCDLVNLILRDVQDHIPDLEIHQVETGIPDQLRMISDGQLDVGFGRASHAPPEVDSEVIRLDPLGVLIPDGHCLAELPTVPVGRLAGQPLLLSDEARAPELNQLVVEACRSAGFIPTLFPGSVGSVRAAAELTAHGRCIPCVPSSCASVLPGVVWRPLVEPECVYPWSVLWRAGDASEQVKAVIAGARRLAAHQGWLEDGAVMPAGAGTRQTVRRRRPFGDLRAS